LLVRAGLPVRRGAETPVFAALQGAAAVSMTPGWKVWSEKQRGASENSWKGFDRKLPLPCDPHHRSLLHPHGRRRIHRHHRRDRHEHRRLPGRGIRRKEAESEY
jgi:hypothetical protein